MNETEEINYNSESQQFLNNQQNITTLQIRLDTSSFLEQMENFLRSRTYVLEVDKKTGKQTPKVVQWGEPLANEEGIRWLMQRLSALINSHSVQGNYKDDRYEQHIWMIRTSLAYNIMTNLYKWEIKDENYHNIIDTFMDIAKPYLSRTLYNEERKSYSQSMQTKEINTIQPPANKGFGGLFK